MSSPSPRDPSAFYKPSIVDQHGNNPFADAAPPVAGSANPYAASAAQAEPSYQPAGYEMSLPHRGNLVLLFGWLGIAGVFISALAALYYWPVAPLNLALTLPAWLWSRSDLRAMQSGAMDAAGRGKTKAGLVLGIIGTLLSLLTFMALVGAAVYESYAQ